MITRIDEFRKINEGKTTIVNDGLWYHGDLRETDFSDHIMDAEDYSRNRNAVGPGIYWTRDDWQARGYGQGGFFYTATVKIDPKRLMTIDHKPTRWFIERFIRLAPKEARETGLSNWMNNMKMAVDAYVQEDDLHESLVGVYNDFYGRDSKAFAKSMINIGFDAYLHHLPAVDHLIVWNTKILNISSIVPTPVSESKLVRESMNETPYTESDATKFQYDFRRFIDGGMDDPKIKEFGLKNLLNIRTAGDQIIINYDKLRRKSGVELMSLMNYKISNKIEELEGRLLEQMIATIVKKFERKCNYKVKHIHNFMGLGTDTLELDK